jgi:serine/threonine-protein kinase
MALLAEGQIIRDTYIVERFLGEGACAEVYRVQHRFLGRQAMKVLKLSGANLGEIENLLAEALLLSRIGQATVARRCNRLGCISHQHLSRRRGR